MFTLSLSFQPSRSLARLRDLARDPLTAWRNRYRPECHYMRGPGPACRRAALARSV